MENVETTKLRQRQNNEKVKKTIDIVGRNTSLQVYQNNFLYISLSCSVNYDVKGPNFELCEKVYLSELGRAPFLQHLRYLQLY